MFALVATSMAGELKKQDKRGLLPANELQAPAPAPFVPSQPLSGPYKYEAPSASAAAPAPAAYAVPAPLPQAPLAQAPLAQAPLQLQQAVQTQVQNTQSVERFNVPLPYPVERTVVKTIGVDRPIPQVNVVS